MKRHKYEHWGLGHMSHPEDPQGCCELPEGHAVHRAEEGRFALKVSSSETSGPPGKGSCAEAEARVPRPPSGIRLRGLGGGWRAQFNTDCARCGEPIVARATFIVMRKGRAIHVECSSGADDE